MRRSRESGFTLIEMIVTVALVAIIASVATPFFKIQQQREKERELKAALREIRSAIDAYKLAGDEGRIKRAADSTGYPKSLDQLVTGVVDQRDPKGRKIHFLRRIPYDPMNPSSPTSAADSWGKRSYASDADDPQEGVDVYDVFSLSDRTGINGIPYRKW
ncbi:general secretion pathway protein GspG [Burkholderia ubonensis]|uniref:type II secretion system protein n=1 Tax=Burkholderia ubonensis TaxID=101571 RepID=UPI00075E878F|nr:type II secretion system protein [Burkholderia ubonensis]KVO10950.1 general secretion pathway protein GspG [Burkholderia ubonensis]KVU50980.1 general secretion pathway protein GspG [Burkholderia ubonensis]KVU91357.1 general secretion pathway protein GspG [Burkholderia ubonensis]KWA81259.1 general secretion pathway protein GspG [Burkholderia ubonensis]KWB17140.1 general secretion pathway protein GspG [Burkholderia ubonensis]